VRSFFQAIGIEMKRDTVNFLGIAQKSGQDQNCKKKNLLHCLIKSQN